MILVLFLFYFLCNKRLNMCFVVGEMLAQRVGSCDLLMD